MVSLYTFLTYNFFTFRLGRLPGRVSTTEVGEAATRCEKEEVTGDEDKIARAVRELWQVLISFYM